MQIMKWAEFLGDFYYDDEANNIFPSLQNWKVGELAAEFMVGSSSEASVKRTTTLKCNAFHRATLPVAIAIESEKYMENVTFLSTFQIEKLKSRRTSRWVYGRR